MFVLTAANLAGGGDEKRGDGLGIADTLANRNRPKNLKSPRLKMNSEVLRKRRAAEDATSFFIAHQFFPRSIKLDKNNVCTIQKDALLVNEFVSSSTHLKVDVSENKDDCQVLLNAMTEAPGDNAKGFNIGGDVGSNSVYDRKLGINYSRVDQMKVEHDLLISLNSGSVDLILSAMSLCRTASAFQCDEETCIPQEAMCDDIKNCGNGSDEVSWRCGVLGESKFLTFLAFFIFAVLFLPPYFLISRWKQKRKPPSSQIGLSSSSTQSPR